MVRKIPFFFVLAVLTGCQTTLSDSSVPARLIGQTLPAIEQIELAISKLLNGKPVTLADSAFSQESTLVIERAPHRDDRGLLIDGRRTEEGVGFMLLLDSGMCWIRRQDTQSAVSLPGIDCVTNK